jgi:hypothetical protein
MKIVTQRTRKGISTTNRCRMDNYPTTGLSISYRKNSGKDEDLVTYDKSDSQQNFVLTATV